MTFRIARRVCEGVLVVWLLGSPGGHGDAGRRSPSSPKTPGSVHSPPAPTPSLPHRGRRHRKARRLKRRQSLPSLPARPKGNFGPRFLSVHFIYRFLILPGNLGRHGHPPPPRSAAMHHPLPPAREARPGRGEHPRHRFTSPSSLLCVSEAARLLLRPPSVSWARAGIRMRSVNTVTRLLLIQRGLNWIKSQILIWNSTGAEHLIPSGWLLYTLLVIYYLQWGGTRGPGRDGAVSSAGRPPQLSSFLGPARLSPKLPAGPRTGPAARLGADFRAAGGWSLAAAVSF